MGPRENLRYGAQGEAKVRGPGGTKGMGPRGNLRYGAQGEPKVWGPGGTKGTGPRGNLRYGVKMLIWSVNNIFRTFKF